MRDWINMVGLLLALTRSLVKKRGNAEGRPLKRPGAKPKKKHGRVGQPPKRLGMPRKKETFVTNKRAEEAKGSNSQLKESRKEFCGGGSSGRVT